MGRLTHYRGESCPWCTVTMSTASPRTSPTREHLVPRVRGGHVGPTVIVCSKCNNDKGDVHLDGWLGLLRARDDRRAYFLAKWMQHNWRTVARVRQLETQWADEQIEQERAHRAAKQAKARHDATSHQRPMDGPA
jgi:hypothetical protein